MNNKLVATALLLVLLLSMFAFLSNTFHIMPVAFGNPTETREVSKPIRLTASSAYDRNPSGFKASNGTWWLFFVRASDALPHVRPPFDPENVSYDVYYMTSIDAGVSWSAETKIPQPSTNQRGMAAFQDQTGKIWVFVSQPMGTNISYYTYDETAWTGPTDVLVEGSPISGNHIDALQAADGKIWIFYESSGVKANNYDGASWSPTITVDGTSGMGIPKAIQDASGKFHVVYANWAGGTYYYSTSPDGTTWTAQPSIIDLPSTVSCDPVIYRDAIGNLGVFYAPWDNATDSQWIEHVRSSDGGATWSWRARVTAGGYGATYWWDMWPESLVDGSKICLFYTSERGDDGISRIDGNIWMCNVVWNLTNNRYEFIQTAIDAASSGDTVIVYDGVYDEQVVINKSLTIQGVGNTTTIVRPSSAAKLTQVFDGLFWYGTPNTKQIAGIIVANVSDGSNVTIKNLKVDESSVTTKPTGADYLAGIFYRETGGTVDAVSVVGGGSWSGGDRAYGIYLSAATNTVSVQIKGSAISNYDKNGIEAMGNKLTVNAHHNTITGRGSTLSGDEVQNGVNVGRGASGTVDFNTISDMDYAPETWWSAGILFVSSSNGSSANNNTIVYCQIGVAFNDMSGSATGNNVSGGTVGKAGLILQQQFSTGTWNASFANNAVTGCDTEGIGAHNYDSNTYLAVTIGNNQLTGGTGDGIFIGDIPEYGPAGNITATIFNNTISKWQHGIHLVSSVAGATITGNTIQNNTGADSGIHIEPAVNATNIHANFNNIIGSDSSGIFNNGTGIIDARLNWWGNETGPYHPTTNPSGTGNIVSDNVDYKPWLIEPYPPAVLAPELHIESVTVEGPSYGKTFTANVTLANVKNLYGFDFKLYWNTTLLDLVNVDLNLPWVSYYTGKNETNEGLGRYWIAVSAQAPEPSFNGSTKLATLTFRITYVPMYPENVSCILDLNETILGDPDAKPIGHVVYDGEYKCYAAKAKIQVLPPVTEVKALNKVFNLSITITNVANLQTFEFALQYNTTHLDAKEIAVGSFVNRSYKVSKKIIDDTQGLVTLRMESISPSLQVNETLVLANITFEATYAVPWTKPSVESSFSFSFTQLMTDMNVTVPHDTIGGLYRYRPIPGDMNNDGKVNILDLGLVARAYGTRPGDPYWNGDADFNHDNIINILDLIPVARNYGRTD